MHPMHNSDIFSFCYFQLWYLKSQTAGKIGIELYKICLHNVTWLTFLSLCNFFQQGLGTFGRSWFAAVHLTATLWKRKINFLASPTVKSLNIHRFRIAIEIVWNKWNSLIQINDTKEKEKNSCIYTKKIECLSVLVVFFQIHRK